MDPQQDMIHLFSPKLLRG